jgi:Zn-dependent peptidase ImmA (M78 family)
MSPRSALAEVKPELLRWARETAGLELSHVARRFSKVENWERGAEQPTVRQLETLSDLYKRPLAAFFLPAPPVEPPAPKDFRVLPADEPRTLSKRVRLAIRRARRIQRLWTELSDATGDQRPSRLPRIAAPTTPETHAANLRGLLQISLDQQYLWHDAREGFRIWRSAVESLGVLALQLTMPTREARGFSLLGSVPVIVVSSSDTLAARSFTLFHELGHLSLNNGGVCLPDPTDLSEPNQNVEPFCNHFSGAVLVPLDSLSARPELTQLPSRPDEFDERLGAAARAFKASRYVLLRRLLIVQRISPTFFQRTMRRWLSSEPSTRRGGGGQKPAAKTLSQLGTRFVSLVLETHARGAITSSDVADYLSLNLKYLPDLQRRVAAQVRG